MRLMTKELEKRFAQVGSQKNVKDPVIVAKFFNTFGLINWYATEYNQKEKVFFGYVSNCVDGDWYGGWTHFSLADLESYPGRLAIERELYWTEKRVSDVPVIR